MYSVYILKSETTKGYYVGQTSDVTERLARHNTHAGRSTKNRGPWKLVLTEEYETRAEAMKRERQIKSYKGGEAFRRLIEKHTHGEVA